MMRLPAPALAVCRSPVVIDMFKSITQMAFQSDNFQRVSLPRPALHGAKCTSRRAAHVAPLPTDNLPTSSLRHFKLDHGSSSRMVDENFIGSINDPLRNLLR